MNDGWEDFFKEGGEGAPYVTFNGKYVTWNTAKLETEAPTFAQKALEYVKGKAKDNSDEPKYKPVAVSKEGDESTYEIGTIVIEGKEWPTYKFKGLPLGYYLVDSTMGALCGLTTTNLHASINAKNGEPTMHKHVQSGTNWGSENTASIGDTVKFHVDITVAAGAESYVLHDELDAGFTFVGIESVTYDGNNVALENYTIKTEGLTDNCDFEVVFDKEYCKTLENGKTLIVSYNAVLNANAVIDGDGNKNVAKLAFGEDHFTELSKTTTKTYAFDLVKTDSQNFLLDGAYFTVHTDSSATEANQIPLIYVESENGNPAYYRPALKNEDGATANPIAVDGGMIRFLGFASGNYYFKETTAPTGYNKLAAPAHFAMPASNKFAIFNDGVYSTNSGFQITNSNGVMLPETGGIGTLLFTALGGSTALGAGVVLVTKKRMSKIKDDEE